MEVAELAKLLGEYGLAVAVLLVLVKGIPALVKALNGFGDRLSEIKDAFISALHEHSDKDMARHEETREAIGEIRENLLVIETRMQERADVTPIRPVKKRAITYPRFAPRKDDEE